MLFPVKVSFLFKVPKKNSELNCNCVPTKYDQDSKHFHTDQWNLLSLII